MVSKIFDDISSLGVLKGQDFNLSFYLTVTSNLDNLQENDECFSESSKRTNPTSYSLTFKMSKTNEKYRLSLDDEPIFKLKQAVEPVKEKESKESIKSMTTSQFILGFRCRNC